MPSPLKLVILESPYADDIMRNTLYARVCLRDSLERGEAPFASHLLYTQERVLNDAIPDERIWGIEAGLAWGAKAELTAVYIDFGVSRGMQFGIDRAIHEGRPIEYRSVGLKMCRCKHERVHHYALMGLCEANNCNCKGFITCGS